MFKNKVILITGSSRGIGAATAKLAVGYGVKVILHGRTESTELKNLASPKNTFITGQTLLVDGGYSISGK